MRAGVYGKRARLRVVAEAEEQARAAEGLEGPAVVEGEQAPVAEAARVKDPALVEDLAVDPGRVDPAAGDPVVEDLGEEQVEAAEPEGEPGRVENRASG